MGLEENCSINMEEMRSHELSMCLFQQKIDKHGQADSCRLQGLLANKPVEISLAHNSSDYSVT